MGREVSCAPEEAAISATAPTPAPATEPAPAPPAAPPALVPAPPPPALAGRQLLKVDLVWAGTIIGLALLVFLLLELARGVGVPLFAATAIAYVIGPIAARLEQRGLSRTLAAALLFVIGFGAFVGMGFYLVPALTDEAHKLPAFFQKALGRASPMVQAHLHIQIPSNVTKLTEELTQRVAQMGDDLLPVAVKALGSTATLLITLLGLAVVPVIAFHFIRLGPRVLEIGESLIPPRYRGHVVARFQEVDTVLGAFVRGQLTVGLVLSVIYGLGFSVAGLDMAVGIALIGGFGNLVPYAGTAMCIGLGAMSLLVSDVATWQVGVALGTFGLAQVLEPLVITPRIVGERVGLHPVAIILAVLGFGELFGFVGVLLAVPTTAALTVVAKVLVARYRESPLYLGR